MKTARICIVGMGIGRSNGRALAANPRGNVTALCDLYQDRMEAFAKELPEPVKYYTDYKAMCQDPDIDAVMVGTPNQWHVPIALEAVKNGKHVLVTKPLADSEEAARTLVEAAEEAGVVNMMSLSMRFSEPVQYLGQLQRQGHFGEVYYAHSRTVRRIGIPGANKGALHFIQKGGGAFRDMGVHYLDSVWWLLDRPKPVSVLGVAGAKFGPRGQGYWNVQHQPPAEYYTQYAADDYGGGFIRFENGIGLHIESFWASHHEDMGQIELFGTEAGAKLRPLTLYTTVNEAPQDLTVELPEKKTTSWDTLAGHFTDCVLDGIPCQAPLRDGLAVQRMMEALLRSAELGKEVRLD
jgi:predicted dehydrogenase